MVEFDKSGRFIKLFFLQKMSILTVLFPFSTAKLSFSDISLQHISTIFVHLLHKTSLFIIMKTIHIIILVGVLALLGGGCYAYSEYNRGHKDLATAKADVVLADAALIKAFVDNETAANGQYLDKVIKIEGTVKNIEKNPEGFYTVYLGAAGGENSVACEMSKEHNAEAETLKAGDKAVFQGKCAGFNILDVSLTECALEKK